MNGRCADEEERRPAGPPASPPEFPPLSFQRGRREDVLVYCEKQKKHIVARNVLFRDYGGGLTKVRTAYWPVLKKATIETIMGHVEICHVLTRSTFTRSRSDTDYDSSSSSLDAKSVEDEDDEEIVFALTTDLVAVKVNYGRRMDRYIGLHAENPLQEISAMELVGNDHPHVLGILEYLVVGHDLEVVMPYVASGDLFDYVVLQRGKLPEEEARYWFRQLLEGVSHLHQRGICHRDLSLENAMIDHNQRLVIIDMGMAIRIPYTDSEVPDQVTDVLHGTESRLIRPQGTCGKMRYMSPEIYKDQAFDGHAVDIWTAGAILYFMLAGRPPYDKPPVSDLELEFLSRDVEELNCSSECIDLLQGILQGDPRLRFSMDEIRKHPWLAQEDVPPCKYTHRKI